MAKDHTNHFFQVQRPDGVNIVLIYMTNQATQERIWIEIYVMNIV